LRLEANASNQELLSSIQRRQEGFVLTALPATPAIHRDGNLLVTKEDLLKATIGARLHDAGY
jgi:hypothetical protein